MRVTGLLFFLILINFNVSANTISLVLNFSETETCCSNHTEDEENNNQCNSSCNCVCCNFIFFTPPLFSEIKILVHNNFVAHREDITIYNSMNPEQQPKPPRIIV